MTLPLPPLASTAEDAARAAAAVIRSTPRDNLDVRDKQGGDSRASQVVTEVDLKCQAAILDRLAPTIRDHDLGLLTEESQDDHSRLKKEAFWCIDPLDGTLPFIENTPGYAVSIALVARDGTPLIGVILDPCRDVLVTAMRGHGCRLNGEPWTMPDPTPQLGHFTDRSSASQPWYENAQAWLADEASRRGLSGVDESLNAGAAINSLRVLANPPACYFKPPRPTRGGGSLWDYAASACIFNEMGAVACGFNGQPLDLNRADSTFLNHHGILFATDAALAGEIIGTFAGIND